MCIKGTISVILSDLPCTDVNARFTTVLSEQNCEKSQFLLMTIFSVVDVSYKQVMRKSLCRETKNEIKRTELNL